MVTRSVGGIDKKFSFESESRSAYNGSGSASVLKEGVTIVSHSLPPLPGGGLSQFLEY